MDCADRFLLGVFADVVMGDPRWFPHPVRAIGLYVSLCEKVLRKLLGASLLLAGFLAGGSAVLLSYFVVHLSIVLAGGAGSFSGGILEIGWIWLGLSAGDLDKSVRRVLDSLRAMDIPLARSRLSLIVGRDTAGLDEPEISRAVVETTAESFVDGIASPIFFYVLGGAPLMWAFKAASTCDSMIGHKDERNILFGRFSARLDDVANFVPARISFPLIFLASLLLRMRDALFHPLDCARACFRDRSSHSSPNAGIPESAFAGALGVRLGGLNHYDGERHDAPLIFGEGRRPHCGDADSALRLMWTVFSLAVISAWAAVRVSGGPLLPLFF